MNFNRKLESDENNNIEEIKLKLSESVSVNTCIV